MAARILVPFDGGPTSQRRLEEAIGLATAQAPARAAGRKTADAASSSGA